VAATEWQAGAGSSAAGRYDLLTVVTHELGHVLGLDDIDPAAAAHDLMTQTLAPGVRRLPEAVAAPGVTFGVSVGGGTASTPGGRPAGPQESLDAIFRDVGDAGSFGG